MVPAAPATLDPRFATDAAAVRITRLVHAGLVTLDPDTLEPTPYLAASWAWRGPLALSVALREGLRFHSGAALEAQDVCATLAAVADPRVGSPHRAVAASIARCEADGPLVLTLTLREPRATLLTDLEVPVLRRDEAASAPRPDGQLDGLGPYRIAAATDDATSLVAAGNGALPRPARDVVVRVVHDENARAVRMLAGRADAAPNAISPALLGALEARGVLVRSRPGANLTYLLVHNQRPGLDDRRAREGLGRAIDRELLVRTLLGGHATVAATFMPPSSWAYSAPERAVPFDVEGARRLLREAGVSHITLLTSTDRQRQTVGRAVGQMLGDAGLEVDVLPLDLGVLLHRLSAGDFEAAILQIPEFTEPNLLRWFFHSSAIPARDGSSAGANRARYASAEVDRLLDLGATEPDRDVRRRHYAAALRQMEHDLPVVPLFHEAQVTALSARARAFEPSAEGRWLSLAAVP
jgi:peptide/nickel transport system substrate-binding protein